MLVVYLLSVISLTVLGSLILLSQLIDLLGKNGSLASKSNGHGSLLALLVLEPSVNVQTLVEFELGLAAGMKKTQQSLLDLYFEIAQVLRLVSTFLEFGHD